MDGLEAGSGATRTTDVAIPCCLGVAELPLSVTSDVRVDIYLELPAHGVLDAIGATNWICPNAVALRASVNPSEITVTSSGEVTALSMEYATMTAADTALASAEVSCGGRECLAEAG